MDQSNCIHKFKKEVQWIFEGAAIKRLQCVDCNFRLFYVDPVAKESDYNWPPKEESVKKETNKKRGK